MAHSNSVRPAPYPKIQRAMAASVVLGNMIAGYVPCKALDSEGLIHDCPHHYCACSRLLTNVVGNVTIVTSSVVECCDLKSLVLLACNVNHDHVNHVWLIKARAQHMYLQAQIHIHLLLICPSGSQIVSSS